MADPVVITMLIGIISLIIERGYSLAVRIKSSSCCGNKVDFEDISQTTSKESKI